MTYPPLNTLKPVAEDIWLIDGPVIRFLGLPFSTRATVVRLEGGGVWVHSPTELTDGLRAEIDALGPVRHLIAPNWLHYVRVAPWQAAYPDALSWAAPGLTRRAAKKGLTLRFDRDLGDEAPPEWEGQIAQMIVRGPAHSEAVFFHERSRTLILTDLIENFETDRMAWWQRPIVWVAGIADPDGKMPIDMAMSFSFRRRYLQRRIQQMIDWAPERVILAHGRWYDRDGVKELERAFRRVLPRDEGEINPKSLDARIRRIEAQRGRPK